MALMPVVTDMYVRAVNGWGFAPQLAAVV